VGFKVEREEMEWDGKEGGDTNGFYIGTWVRLLKKLTSRFAKNLKPRPFVSTLIEELLSNSFRNEEIK
jgi:hypothetical protein